MMDKKLYRIDKDGVPRVEMEFPEVTDDGEMAGQSGICAYKLYKAQLADTDTTFVIFLSDGGHIYQHLPDGFLWKRWSVQ